MRSNPAQIAAPSTSSGNNGSRVALNALKVDMEDYIPENLPQHRPVYHLFHVYDIEEGRL